MRTQVGIVGAGPAGLLLSLMLQRRGIESVIVEAREREAIEATIRAGILEQSTVDLMVETRRRGSAAARGRGARGHPPPLRRPQPPHRLRVADRRPGRHPLPAARGAEGPDHGAARRRRRRSCSGKGAASRGRGARPRHPLRRPGRRGAGAALRLHRGLRRLLRREPPRHPGGSKRKDYLRIYPFGWFGILCEAPPSSEELVYARHDRGFALISSRTPEVQRMYFQCDPNDKVENWSDDRIWEELQARVEGEDGFRLKEGRIFQKNIVPMRSFVCEPMQYGRLFLAGDAAHAVPPTGAKGLNLAASDVCARPRARRLLRRRLDRPAGRLHGHGAAAGLAGAALLLVDDLHAAPVPRTRASSTTGASSPSSSS